MSEHVPLVIGTHTWAPDNDKEVGKLLDVMRKHQLTMLDTARLYGPSESILGQRELASEFTIDTKAGTGLSAGSGKNILQSAKESMEALRTNKVPGASLTIIKVRIYFLHAPDEATPVEQQIEAIQTLYKQGMFEKLGLSNFTKEQVIEYHDYAKSKGYVLPTVYQCSYSIVVRLNETGLFPTLRKLGISIQAYSPMAGGLLAKTPEYIELGKGNWDPNTLYGKLFRDLYYKPSYMNLLNDFGSLSEKSGISRAGLAYRWVRYHSQLTPDLGDEMILGSVTAEQLEQALAELNSGPLPQLVVKRIDELWEGVRDDSPTNNLASIRKVIQANL
ncbi:MAG: hypothetical protein Q9177_004871 [Variospora cf. flavescens]